MNVTTCKCGQEPGDCVCDKREHHRISVSQAVLTWYESVQRCGQFGLYSLLEFVRNCVGRQVSDSSLTADLRRLRRQGRIEYRVVDERSGLYEFTGGAML